MGILTIEKIIDAYSNPWKCFVVDFFFKSPIYKFQLKSAESGFSGGGTGNETNDNGDMHPPPANGSIITMTLKNNHLIVETEVRNVSITQTRLYLSISKPTKFENLKIYDAVEFEFLNLPVGVRTETFGFIMVKLYRTAIM